ncbi:MAG: cytochrome-c peroxidase [Thermoleophilia bacterium]
MRTRGLAVAMLSGALLLASAGIASAGTLTDEEALGKLIFFDETLSRPVGQSCASCHDPAAGFADPRTELPVSTGAVLSRVGSRNASSVAYARYSPPLGFLAMMSPKMEPNGETVGPKGVYSGGQFWDGRASTLLEQATQPFLNPLEMHNPNELSVVNSIRRGEYADLFEKVYGKGSLNFRNVQTAFGQIAEALDAYQKSAEVSPFNSKYDAYRAGDVALSENEAAGLALFEGKGGCSACHRTTSVGLTPPLFTSFHHANMGVPSNPENPYFGLPPAFNPQGDLFVDLGDGGVQETLRELLDQEKPLPDPAWDGDGRFKMPSLRNVAVTPPYMHNGVFATLREVVEFYDSRDEGVWPAPEVNKNVIKNPPGRLDVDLGNLELNETEIDQIVAFLGTLTDNWQN